MATPKTRAILVDVARQLFAKNGIEDTTMNDIALASQKGRRTLYTYFKNKEEIFYAVVESELEILSDRMFDVAELDLDPAEKIIQLIYTRLEAIKEIVYRNGTLRAEFFRDIWGVEKVRKEFDSKQLELFRRVLTQGKSLGIFNIDNVSLTASILHYCLKGLEVPYVRGIIKKDSTIDDAKPYVTKIVLEALGMNLEV